MFNVSIYVFEYIESEEAYREKHENQNEFISHCVILNHIYTNSKAQGFELLTINQFFSIWKN